MMNPRALLITGFGLNCEAETEYCLRPPAPRSTGCI